MRAFKYLFFLTVFIYQAQPVFAAPATLYNQFGGKTVKVFVDEIKDSTQNHKVNPADIRARLSEALTGRKSIRFQMVDSPGNADLVIHVDLKDFFWSNHDPVDMIAGLGATAMDVAVVEDYAKLDADFTVTDARTGKPLWQDRVIATITKKPMSEIESLPLVTEDLAKVFIKQCFGKKRR